MQCRERVDILEALRRSRKEAKADGVRVDGLNLGTQPPLPEKLPRPAFDRQTSQVSLNIQSDLSKPLPYQSRPMPPPLPQRPVVSPASPDPANMRSNSSIKSPQVGSPLPYSPPPALPIPSRPSSRTPSPDKKGGMLRTLRTKDGKKPTKAARDLSGKRNQPPPASSKAAGLAWDYNPRTAAQRLGVGERSASSLTLDSSRRTSLEADVNSRPASSAMRPSPALGGDNLIRSKSPTGPQLSIPNGYQRPLSRADEQRDDLGNGSLHSVRSGPNQALKDSPPQPSSESNVQQLRRAKPYDQPSLEKPPVDFPSYMKEYRPTVLSQQDIAKVQAMRAGRPAVPNMSNLPSRQKSPMKRRRPVPNSSSPMSKKPLERNTSSDSTGEDTSDSRERSSSKFASLAAARTSTNSRKTTSRKKSIAPDFDDEDEGQEPAIPLAEMTLQDRIKYVKKHLPKGVDDHAAKNIFNEIVVQGDEVHWEDVAGLDVAKKALKEAVVYPFLRPDLFMGLREPARGMLLFGPPGTGKTMLARAVATESRSTFFAISASSLTSKWLGESEKLVRALFALAKALAPSIIFVDEIDSLLSSRGGSSEHESTRRIKTEFLIQWSDLQRAAAGKQQTEKEILEGDPSRVLVLAATNCPWAIDDAARRRFVRRQYIPLPEAEVRESQLLTLLSHQKHSLSRKDIKVLVELTDGKQPLPLPSRAALGKRHVIARDKSLLTDPSC